MKPALTSGTVASAVQISLGCGPYRLIGLTEIAEAQLKPRGWTPSLAIGPSPDELDRLRWLAESGIQKPPFVLWTLFERCADLADGHGPSRFSLLYVGGDGVATYDALYRGNRCAPEFLCLIRPGTGFGGNYTDFHAPDGLLARLVQGAPGAAPSYIVSDHVGSNCTSCWPDAYPQALPHIPNRRDVRIWSHG